MRGAKISKTPIWQLYEREYTGNSGKPCMIHLPNEGWNGWRCEVKQGKRYPDRWFCYHYFMIPVLGRTAPYDLPEDS